MYVYLESGDEIELLGKGYIKNSVQKLQKTCDHKDLESCGVLVFLYKRGKGVEQDITKAIELLKKLVIVWRSSWLRSFRVFLRSYRDSL